LRLLVLPFLVVVLHVLLLPFSSILVVSLSVVLVSLLVAILYSFSIPHAVFPVVSIFSLSFFAIIRSCLLSLCVLVVVSLVVLPCISDPLSLIHALVLSLLSRIRFSCLSSQSGLKTVDLVLLFRRACGQGEKAEADGEDQQQLVHLRSRSLLL